MLSKVPRLVLSNDDNTSGSPSSVDLGYRKLQLRATLGSSRDEVVALVLFLGICAWTEPPSCRFEQERYRLFIDVKHCCGSNQIAQEDSKC